MLGPEPPRDRPPSLGPVGVDAGLQDLAASRCPRPPETRPALALDAAHAQQAWGRARRRAGQQGQRGQRGAPAASGNLATLLRLDKPNFPGVGGAQAAAKLQSSRRYLDRPPHYKLAPTAGVSLGRAHLLASPRANVCSSQCECVPCAWCVSAGDCVCRCEHELRPRRGTHVCGTRV